jgi:hypothetical protein
VLYKENFKFSPCIFPLEYWETLHSWKIAILIFHLYKVPKLFFKLKIYFIFFGKEQFSALPLLFPCPALELLTPSWDACY